MHRHQLDGDITMSFVVMFGHEAFTCFIFTFTCVDTLSFDITLLCVINWLTFNHDDTLGCDIIMPCDITLHCVIHSSG